MTTAGENALTKKEWERMLMKIDYLRDEVLLKLAVETGIRRKDIVSIRVNDIDFNERKITFYENKKRKLHSVYISEKMLLLIRKYINTFSKKQEQLFNISDRQAWNILNKYLVKANIKQRGFHALRGTCIKFAQLKGWSESQTAKHLDDTIRTIQEHYATPSDLEMKEVAQTKSVFNDD